MTTNGQGQQRFWLILSQAPGLGAGGVADLVKHFGSAEAACQASDSSLAQAGLKPQTRAAIRDPDRALLETSLDWAGQSAHQAILTPVDPNYPARLLELPSPPPVLFVAGDVGALSEPQLAMVGSRNPTRGGAETATAFARHLAGLGLTITSGLALGIDAASHLGALEAGQTIAVMGTGPDRIYPAANRALAERIIEQGALVTEFPPGTGPQGSHFPRRNRLISGLSLGTLVVEAAPGSGSLITARYAVEQGREVFAIPGSIHNPLARGCHALIRQGAKLVDAADQLLEELAPQLRPFTLEAPPTRPVRRSSRTKSTPAIAEQSTQNSPRLGSMDPDHRRLLDAMGFDPVAPNELITRTGFSAQVVSSMLLLLELQGHVSSLPGGRFALRSGDSPV